MSAFWCEGARLRVYTYPCPCGDKFSISIDELADGEEIAKDYEHICKLAV